MQSSSAFGLVSMEKAKLNTECIVGVFETKSGVDALNEDPLFVGVVFLLRYMHALCIFPV